MNLRNFSYRRMRRDAVSMRSMPGWTNAARMPMWDRPTTPMGPDIDNPSWNDRLVFHYAPLRAKKPKILDLSLHNRESSFREKLIEHLFVGELLKYSWHKAQRARVPLIELSRADVDRGGYDLIVEFGGCLRHVQLKGSVRGSTVAEQKVHVALADKPSACVIWVFFDENEWDLGPFLYFWGQPGAPIPPLGEKVARHSKGDAKGIKKERPNVKRINKGRFRTLQTVEELWEVLFGTSEAGTK